MRLRYILVVALLLSLALGVGRLSAGSNLEPPAGPTDPAAQMYTLEQIYDRLDDGTAATKMATFTEPSSGPGSTMHTLEETYDLLGERAPVPKTGQTDCYLSASPWGTCTCGATNCPSGQDGGLEKGVSWPSTRFTDHGDGTVTDHLSGLIWLKDGDCMGTRTWSNSFTQVSNLNSGTEFSCDSYTKGTFSDWRLPKVRELFSLIHHGQANSATWLNTQGFSGVHPSYYWSSTTNANGTAVAWYVSLSFGYVSNDLKTVAHYVWPVRGGQ